MLCFSQQVTVLDLDSGQPISNIAVFNKDKIKITLTDFDGNFDSSIFSRSERIFLKHIGYEQYSIKKEKLRRQGFKVVLVAKAQ